MSSNISARFLREFLAQPMATGAIVPSSEALGKAIVRNLNLSNAKAVVEYGPGTGAFTTYVLQTLDHDARFIAIEINPRLADMFRIQHPDVQIFQDSVANAREICNEAGIDQVDCIVSGLPWASFQESMQVEFLDEMMRVLKPGGKFVTFAYVHGLFLPPGRRFSKILPKYFSSITKSPVVWNNFPPAFVYSCTR
jgi:phosphatidylethanolamine/phosphatidyl-N-methylethanolamine N-methyltransferase